MILKRKNIIIAVALVIAAAAVVVFFSQPKKPDPEFTLPTPLITPQQSPSQTDAGRLDMSRDNVLSVLGTLKRANAYIHEMEFVTYWDGGRSSVTIHVAADGGKYFVVRDNGNESKKFLSLEDGFWIWYNDDKSNAFHGILGEDKTREIDEFMQFVTYENFEETADLTVLDAALVEYDGLSCIYMEYSHGSATDYTTRIYISVEYGIIVAEETTDMIGNLAFEISTMSLNITTPPESAFLPPSVNPEGTSQP